MAVQPRLQSAFDRLPPQDIDAERCVLGAMLLNPDAVGTAIETLHEKPDDVFYADAHAHIYEAALELFRKNVPIDALTLKAELTRTGKLELAGGLAYLTELSSAVPTSANVAHYAGIVMEAALLRKVIAVCSRVAGDAYEPATTVRELLDRAERDIFQIAEEGMTTPVHRLPDLLAENVDVIARLLESGESITGVPSGFTKLDEMTFGFQPSDMIVVAARPSVGKTAFALNIARQAAVHHDKTILIFSLEMAKEQLVHRLLYMEGNVDGRKLRTGFLPRSALSKVRQAADRLSWARIHVDDTPNITIFELKSKARRVKGQGGLDMVIVDYLQLMSAVGRAESRQVEISEISRGIKALARELEVPVIALSQLNREADKDDTGMPKLSHLRESGAIEQDADVVLMLSRPPAHERTIELETINVSVAKQRNGPTGSFELMFDRPVQRFKQPDTEHYRAPPPEHEAPPGDGPDEDVPF